jgi:Rhs element Vgr protein
MTVIIPAVLVGGRALDQAHRILAIDVIREVNRVPRASITLVDGDVPQQRFPLADSGLLEPGKELEVRVRLAGVETSLFKGPILRIALEVGGNGPTLTVEASDAAHRLTQRRRSAVFTESSDVDAIRRIIEEAGLTTGELPSGGPVHPCLVQYHCTDWDFILARADVAGLLVLVQDGTISLKPMVPEGAADATFELGRDEILEYALEFDASRQHPEAESFAWDIAQQQRTVATSGQATSLAQGKYNAADLGEILRLGTWRLAHMVPLLQEELQNWVNARLTRRRLAMIRGRLTVAGRATLPALGLAELKGMGDGFNGTVLMSGVRQRLTPGDWRTDIQFGLAPDGFAYEPGIQDAEAAGLLPAVGGIQIGLVAAFEADPLGEYRVRITLPGIDDSGAAAVWARLATPEAGAGRGLFFGPKPGDEVVVGFLNNDPRQPIVLGSLYSSKNAPGGDFVELSEANEHKGIATASGAVLAFRDRDKPMLTLRTPRGTLEIDDDGERVELFDRDGNMVRLDSSGVTIKSAKDLVIEASGKITIKGSEVDIA